MSWAVTALAPWERAPAAHHRLLLHRLDAVSRGDIDRLIVLMPPGSAKSTYASILFPVWWFTQHPASAIIATSHTADLANYFGRQVRDMIAEHSPQLGYDLSYGKRAAARWHTSTRGEYFATGIRGPIAGRRADLAIIDDPVKSQAEVDSPRQREHLWNWFRADLTTRLKPGGRIVLIMTRWHDDDLAGHLLAHEASQWDVIRLPAIAEAADPLGRAIGSPLWPEWEDIAALDRKRLSVGERVWSALFQQAPRPPAGGLFNVTRLETLDTLPIAEPEHVVRAWDLAATTCTGANNPDWTAGVKLQRDRAGRYTVLDVVRFRATPHQVLETILLTAKADGRSVTVGLPEDPGQAGKQQVAYYVGRLAGFHVVTSRDTGAKVTRAIPVASQVEAGNFAILRANWNYIFREELGDFPHGHKDDQVDALSRAFAMLIEPANPARRASVALIAR
jgi:predicted phage terminase large subunit-like protein